MQAIADASFKFLDISLGYPGSLHDSRVLTLSPIYDAILKEEVMAAPKTEISGHTIVPMLAGDNAYPLNRHIITPFSKRRRMSRAEKNFNRKICALRSVFERSFGLLKNRWRLLYKINEAKLENAARSINAARVLHNVCIENEDLGHDFEEELEQNNDDFNNVINEISDDGDDIRNAIFDFMVDQGLIPT